MLKMPLFHAWGVKPTSPTMFPICSLVESNIPVRLLMMPLISTSFSQSVICSHRKSIGVPPFLWYYSASGTRSQYTTYRCFPPEA